MTLRIRVNAEGGVTIPAELRQAAGFDRAGELLVEVLEGQIVLIDRERPESEVYTDERIAEFEAEAHAAAPAIQAYLSERGGSGETQP